MLIPREATRANDVVRSNGPRSRAAPWLVALSLALSACAGPQFDWQGRSPAALAEYRAEFDRNAGIRWAGDADVDDFVALARSRRVLFLGDHHRDERLHARQRDLLRRLFAAGPTTLLLEAVGIEDQASVDDYLDGRIGMPGLVATCRARWPQAWIAGGDVDSEHYCELLRAARDQHVRVFGLEPAPRLPLAQRDARIAAQTRAVANARPDTLVVVLLGQDHLLGEGRVAGLVAMPCTVVGAAPSEALWRARPITTRSFAWRTERDVWFFSQR